MKIRESGSTSVSATTTKNTVLLKAKNSTIAEFTIKPSNADDTDLDLDNFVLTGTKRTYEATARECSANKVHEDASCSKDTPVVNTELATQEACEAVAGYKRNSTKCETDLTNQTGCELANGTWTPEQEAVTYTTEEACKAAE
jgi:hypothetical protein